MLRIPRVLMDALRAHAREGAPDEVCGILAGATRGEAHEVGRVFRVPNVHASPRVAYLLDPVEQLRSILEIEDELGFDVVGFYHSHPAGPAAFSAEDVARASWPGASYLLLHPGGERSARWDDTTGHLRDEPIVIV